MANPTAPSVPTALRTYNRPTKYRRHRPSAPYTRIYTGITEITNACVDFRENVLRIDSYELADLLGLNPTHIVSFEKGSGRLSMLTCYYHAAADSYQRTVFLKMIGEALELAGKPVAMSVKQWRGETATSDGVTAVAADDVSENCDD